MYKAEKIKHFLLTLYQSVVVYLCNNGHSEYHSIEDKNVNNVI